MIRRIAPLVLMALASVAGCGGSDRALTPTQPSPPSGGAGSTNVNGEITMAAIRPDPGATVHVRPCAPASTRFCADQPQATFDVLVDRDIPDAVLTVNFGACGIASTSVTALTAGRRTPLTINVIDLSDDGPFHDGIGAALFCDLPAASGRMLVSLRRSGQPATSLLTREFAYSYAFAMPQ